MVKQPLFENGRADQVEPVLGQLDLDAAAPVEQMRQHDAADLLRQSVGDQSVQERGCIGTADFNLGESCHIHDADTAAHGAHFRADDIVHHVAPERIVVPLLDTVAGEPTRAFMAIHFLENRALFPQPVIERT